MVVVVVAVVAAIAGASAAAAKTSVLHRNCRQKVRMNQGKEKKKYTNVGRPS